MTRRAMPGADDPIFACIQDHRTAWTKFSARCSALDRANTPKARAEWERLNDTHEEAASVLAKTEPTTIAGAVALLRYVSEIEYIDRDILPNLFEDEAASSSKYGKPWPYFMHHSLAKALENMKTRQAQSA